MGIAFESDMLDSFAFLHVKNRQAGLGSGYIMDRFGDGLAPQGGKGEFAIEREINQVRPVSRVRDPSYNPIRDGIEDGDAVA